MRNLSIWIIFSTAQQKINAKSLTVSNHSDEIASRVPPGSGGKKDWKTNSTDTSERQYRCNSFLVIVHIHSLEILYSYEA